MNKTKGEESNMREKNIKKQIWIDEKEDELLKKKSKEAGLSESEFIRSVIKGYTIKSQPTEEIKLFQGELYGIANNINQIARIANSKFSVSHDAFENISKALTDFILRFEKKIYSRQKQGGIEWQLQNIQLLKIIQRQ